MKIFLATGNLNKIKEMEKILENVKNLEILTLKDGIEIPEIIENKETFEDNSIKKAVEIAKYLNMIVIADDSGLCARALGGAPGIYSARFAGEHKNDLDNNNKLIKELKNKEDRHAKFVSVITIANPRGNYKSFHGEICGEIIDNSLGENGFGYDPHFYLRDYQMTIAQLPTDEKNRISHRAKALELLKAEIDTILVEFN